MPTAYLNRGIAAIRLNDAAQWQPDLARVLALQPDYPGARLALCWAHALDKQPQLALPHCDAAVSRAASARYGSTRADWLQMLKAGKNPIDAVTLEKLRRE